MSISGSTSSVHTDREIKLRLYAHHGVPWYWIVDPYARTIDAYRLEDRAFALDAHAAHEDSFRPTQFPGLEIPLSRLRGE